MKIDTNAALNVATLSIFSSLIKLLYDFNAHRYAL